MTGADLKTRIEAIMTNRISHRLTLARRTLLAAAGMAAVAGPIVVGIVNSPRVRAQSQSGGVPLTFEVASIKPADPDASGTRFRMIPGGGVNLSNIDLTQLIEFAYDVQNFQVSGGPSWLRSTRFDILAKPPASDPSIGTRPMNNAELRALEGQLRERLKALLAERFQLTVHKDTKELPLYVLVLAKNGPKLQPSKEGDYHRGIRVGLGSMNVQAASMEMLAKTLSRPLGRPVLDRTGLKGNYDFNLNWTPDGEPMGKGGAGEGPASGKPADVSGPSLFTAVQEQLGLKLESQKGPVEIIVIDKAEKPSAN